MKCTLVCLLILAACARVMAAPPDYEREIHEAVPGSKYVQLGDAGHFPCTERPDAVNALIEEFAATLPNTRA